MPVQFFSEKVFFSLQNSSFYALWLKRIISDNKKELANLNYIFCSDEYLLKVNQDYLNHNYYTDVIAFDNAESEKMIEGDVFISIDRIRENATSLSVPFDLELSRVLVHGLLHLLGYRDKTDEEKVLMREKEEACISLQKQ